MTVFANQAIADVGEVNFGGGQQIQFALVHVTDVGFEARPIEAGSPDHMLRIGWLSFGNDTDLIDATSRTYWTQPKWIDFVNWQWHPEPTRDPGTTDLTVWASRIRWQLYSGVQAWLFVVGA